MSRSAINITGTNIEGTNLGAGNGVYACVSPTGNLNLKSLTSAGGISITNSATEIQISGGSGASAAGVDTSVQFNNAGAFSGSTNITWDEANTQLDVVGDIAISGTSFLRAGANDIGSIELGESTSAIGTDTISIGNNSYSNDNCSISLGYYAKSNGIGGITIGNDTEVSGDTSIAIGSGSAAKNDGGISIGVSAGGGTTTSFGIQSIFIGAHAGCNSALGTGAIGIGYKAIACTVDGVAIGRLAIATGSGTAVGRGATTNTGTVVGRLACTVSGAVALGYKSCALALRDVAIGDTATADGAFGTAIGFSAYASGLASMAIGCGADSTGATSIAFGSQAAAYGTGAIGIGTGAKSKGSNTVAIGTGAIVDSAAICGIAIGRTAVSCSQYATVIGQSSLITDDSCGAVLIGHVSNIFSGASAVVIGNNTCVMADQSIAIGDSATACAVCSIAMGRAANTNESLWATAIGGSTVVTNNSNYSIAMGRLAKVTSGTSAISLGQNAHSYAAQAIALGKDTDACAANSIALGWRAQALGSSSHAIGSDTCATADRALALGAYTEATASNAQMIGVGVNSGTNVINDVANSIAFGWAQKEPKIRFANSASQFINGNGDLIIGSGGTITGTTALAKVHIQGDIAIVDGTQQDGYVLTSDASGIATWQSGGTGGSTSPAGSTTEIQFNDGGSFGANPVLTLDKTNSGFTAGHRTGTIGKGSTVLGGYGWGGISANIASCESSHAEGFATQALCYSSHAEGQYTCSISYGTHAEGRYTIASGDTSHAEGMWSCALGAYSHAEGRYSCTIGIRSHAEGNNTKAYGDDSHAQNHQSKACGHNSHAEGSFSYAIGCTSHAQGASTQAVGNCSHTGGASGGAGRLIYACGNVSFNHSQNCAGQTAGHGAIANNSAILGGVDHNIESGNTCAAIVGGNGIKLTGTSYQDTTAVSKLAIFNIPTSAAGLATGMVWSNSGVLTIV